MPRASKDLHLSASVCENGHVQHSTSNIVCPECGAKALANCPSCGAEITIIRTVARSTTDGKTVTDKSYSYCNKCAAPYPWTSRAQDIAMRIIRADEALSKDEGDEIESLLPGIIQEGPVAEIAASRIKQIIQKASPMASKAIYDFAIALSSNLACRFWGF